MTQNKASASADADTHTLHKQWDKTTCPICMDHPHNAVLLLCSSHDKGCRPYICNTSYRHSNCLDRFRMLRSNLRFNPAQSSSSFLQLSESERQRQDTPHSDSVLMGSRVARNLLEIHEDFNLEEDSSETMAPLVGNNSQDPNVVNTEEIGSRNLSDPNEILKCPLCRGNVLGWKIVEEARQYLDQKPRSCSCESCSFLGNYGDLRRHARRIHPTTCPSDIDKSRQRAWHHLEHQWEHGDILSAIRSAMPNAVILGDYVIEHGAWLSRDRDALDTSDYIGQRWTTPLHTMSNPLGQFNETRHLSRAWRVQQRSSRLRNLHGGHSLGVRNSNDVGNLNADSFRVSRRRRRFGR